MISQNSNFAQSSSPPGRRRRSNLPINTDQPPQFDVSTFPPERRRFNKRRRFKKRRRFNASPVCCSPHPHPRVNPDPPGELAPRVGGVELRAGLGDSDSRRVQAWTRHPRRPRR